MNPGGPHATVLDERGRLCPLPVIALGRTARALPAGSLVTLLADDPAAEHDVPAWCAMRGATLLATSPDSDGDRSWTCFEVLLAG